MKIEYRERLRNIAEHYGPDSQGRQLIEEMAELTQALTKLQRMNESFKNGKCSPSLIRMNRMVALQHLAEELADVSICLEQVIALESLETEVDYYIDAKINRQEGRIADESRTET